MAKFTATIELAGQKLLFELEARDLDLGAAEMVPYYWMDDRQFRRRPPGANFRACVDHWWTIIGMRGDPDDYDVANLVLAELYPYVSTARSLQNTYLDARLHKDADLQRRFVLENGTRQAETERMYSLPEAECQRLRTLAASHNTDEVQKAIESLFLGEVAGKNDMPELQKSFDDFLRDGLTAFRAGGSQRLRKYIGSIDKLFSSRRKRGSAERNRLFMNMVQYECKAAFYLCYANTWVDLVPWLEQHYKLSSYSKRLLHLWHNQNQPRENPDNIPGASRDVFCGQVLSLHPLSAFIFGKPEHRVVLGKWISHPDYDNLERQNAFGSAPEYWDLVATILIAATEYKNVREQWDASRGKKEQVQSRLVEAAADTNAGAASLSLTLTDYAAEKKLSCPQCDGAVEYDGFDHHDGKPDTVVVWYICPKCHHRFSNGVSGAEVKKFLQD